MNTKWNKVGVNIPKQFIEIQGKPIFTYTFEAFQNDFQLDAIEIIYHKDWMHKVMDICQKYDVSKFKWGTNGGTTFQ